MSELRCATAHSEHVLVAVSQHAKLRGYRILRLSTDCPPLVKELAYRALAADDRLAGHPWQLNARIVSAGTTQAGIVLEAWVTDPQAPTSRLLVSVAIPPKNFAWVASEIAAQLNLTGSCQFQVMVLDDKHPLVEHWTSSRDPDPDFVVTAGAKPSLRLPPRAAEAPLPAFAQVMGPATGTWLRCVFSRRAFEDFHRAARQEKETERSWAGLGRVHLLPDRCYTTIEELIPLPGEAGLSWIRTRGRDFADLCHRFGNRLSAYLHLHPHMLEGQPTRPAPSDNDRVVAWNYSTATAIPCVFPIALFGGDCDSATATVGVYGYDKGVLSAIPWEVLTE